MGGSRNEVRLDPNTVAWEASGHELLPYELAHRDEEAHTLCPGLSTLVDLNARRDGKRGCNRTPVAAVHYRSPGDTPDAQVARTAIAQQVCVGAHQAEVVQCRYDRDAMHSTGLENGGADKWEGVVDMHDVRSNLSQYPFQPSAVLRRPHDPAGNGGPL
jgi:hypothetical protein